MVISRGFILSFVFAVFCCNSVILGHWPFSRNQITVQAEDDATQVNTTNLLCFNNKLIYLGCNEAFRLNQSGILNIPDNATDQFCKGPCPVETKLLLKCIDKLASTYLFENNARTQDIRNALAAGCSSYTGERGNFDMRGFIQGGSSNSKSLSHIPIRYHALAVVALWYFLLIYHH